jgi:hypothetical protein
MTTILILDISAMPSGTVSTAAQDEACSRSGC